MAEEVAKLKAEGKTAALFGGVDTAAELLRLGLIDEYRLFVHPVVLGGGRRLFPDLADRAKLKLVKAVTFDPVVHLHYTR